MSNSLVFSLSVYKSDVLSNFSLFGGGYGYRRVSLSVCLSVGLSVSERLFCVHVCLSFSQSLSLSVCVGQPVYVSDCHWLVCLSFVSRFLCLDSV